jgi:predicted small metal-binding protein
VSWLGYTFKCRDLGLNCDYQATADNSADVVKQATSHAMQAHRAEAMTLASKIKDAVKMA